MKNQAHHFDTLSMFGLARQEPQSHSCLHDWEEINLSLKKLQLRLV